MKSNVMDVGGVVCLAICLTTTFGFPTTSTIHPFKFVCGNKKNPSICTKDVEFCDSDDVILGTTCKRCNEDVCKEENPPDQCYDYCKNLKTPIQKPTAKSFTTRSDCSNGPFKTPFIIVCAFLVVACVPIIVVMVKCIIYSKRKIEPISNETEGAYSGSPEQTAEVPNARTTSSQPTSYTGELKEKKGKEGKRTANNHVVAHDSGSETSETVPKSVEFTRF